MLVLELEHLQGKPEAAAFIVHYQGTLVKTKKPTPARCCLLTKLYLDFLLIQGVMWNLVIMSLCLLWSVTIPQCNGCYIVSP